VQRATADPRLCTAVGNFPGTRPQHALVLTILRLWFGAGVYFSERLRVSLGFFSGVLIPDYALQSFSCAANH
jgi:hypothetical protein